MTDQDSFGTAHIKCRSSAEVPQSINWGSAWSGGVSYLDVYACYPYDGDGGYCESYCDYQYSYCYCYCYEYLFIILATRIQIYSPSPPQVPK